MNKKNEIITNHYKSNYNKLVKRTQYRVPHKSVALAEEVVQEAYRRALDYFKTFNPKINKFDVWFNTILRNATNDCRTSETDGGVTRELEENTEDIRATKGDEHPTLMLEIVDVKRSKRDRQILFLFYINGLTSKDISEFMGMKHTNVRQIIYKFKNVLNEDSS